MSECIVYTCVTDGYDSLKPTKGLNGICLADGDTEEVDGWTLEKYDSVCKSGERNSRFPKCCPQSFFESEYSIWCDGSVAWRVNPRKLIDFMGNAHMACFSHPAGKRQVVDEVKGVAGGVSDMSRTSCQYIEYKKRGFPDVPDLFWENTVIIRRHTPETERFGALWWAEQCRWSSWDQVSFNYVLWKTGMRVAQIPGSVRDGRLCSKHKHKEGRKVLP